ncbi:MAG TPA: choice-of-anchor tandem repeat GloVer-containing protein [Candidatus Cybelea sp.]|jgi:uncharacterized repeat protein (TIGR03803 family)
MLAACGGSQPLIGAPGTLLPASTSAGYRVLHNFGAAKSPDGQQPKAGLIDLNGTLYGTTYVGGAHGFGTGLPGYGTVFSITPDGSERVIYDFKGPKVGDGKNPAASLFAVNGVLYGTTENGGTRANYGTVFSVSTSGMEKVLYRFQGYFYGQDGANPLASLIDVDGKLYGTTLAGGTNDNGTVFRVTTTGEEKVLHSFFQGYSDGGSPVANLLNVKGTLYGTTEYGGQACSCNGGGTIFSITRTGTEKVLFAFNQYTNPEGSFPQVGLIHVKGLLYGTTPKDGAYTDGGTAFSITTTGSISVLHTFSSGSGPDGSGPDAPLLNVKGTLYGTTEFGGDYGKGTVYKMSLTGSKEKVLHSFGYGSDGATPVAGLIDVNGTLYGTTSAGGTNGNGTVFALKLPR